MEMLIREYDKDLSTRILGDKIKNDLTNCLKKNTNDKIVIDFKDVLTITHSCADEAFAVLAKEIGFETFIKRFAFKNLNDEAKSIVISAIANRVSSEQ